MAKNLSELIDAHEKVHGKQKSTPNFPTIQSLRMTNEQKRKKQKRDWYHKNKEIVLKLFLFYYICNFKLNKK